MPGGGGGAAGAGAGRPVQQGHRMLQEQARRPGNVGPRCTKAPPGWACHRTEGHDGPCAASPTVPGGGRPEDPAVG